MEKNYTNQQLFSYAYLSVSFNYQQDVLKNYVNLIEYYLAERKLEKNNILFEVLHKEINDLYGIQMPQATLRKLLQIMQREGKIKFVGKDIDISYIRFNSDYLNHKEEIENRVQVLLIDFIEFLHGKGIKINDCDAKGLFFKFIQSNSFVVAEIYMHRGMTISDEIEYSAEIVEYLRKVKDARKEIYETILHLAMGAIRTSLLNLDPEKIKNLSSNNVAVEKVILDTNYLLRLLNLQGRLDCKIAGETFEMLKKLNVSFIVHEKTVSEMLTSISHYLFQTDTVTPATREILSKNSIGMTGFLAAEENGVTRSTLLQYRSRDFTISEIEKLGCTLVDDTVLIDKSLVDELVKEKNRATYTKENAEHDITLIEYCSQLRRNKKKPINDEKVWVLTNDVKLTEWHKQKCRSYGHACITESQLASYIWLQTGNTGVELNYAILALASQNILGIDQVVDFQKSYIDFAQHNSSIDIQQLVLVFACGELSKKDIVDMHDNEGIGNLITQKIINIQKEEKEKEFAIQEQAKIFETRIKEGQEGIQRERQELIEDSLSIKNQITQLTDEKSKLDNEIIVLEKAKTKLASTARWVIASLFFLCFMIFFIAKLLVETTVPREEQNNFIGLWLPIICTVGFPFVIAVVGTFFTGKFCNFKEFFKWIVLRISKQGISLQLQAINISCRIDIDEFAKIIDEKKNQLRINQEALTSLSLEKAKTEFAISRIDRLIL